MFPFISRLFIAVLCVGLIYASVAGGAEPSSTPGKPDILVGSPEPPQKIVLRPPVRPVHARRSLDSAAELAEDLAQVVRFLEDGQAYYRAYSKGTHTVEENELFLGFLQAYEAEFALAEKESAALSKWIKKRGALD